MLCCPFNDAAYDSTLFPAPMSVFDLLLSSEVPAIASFLLARPVKPVTEPERYAFMET